MIAISELNDMNSKDNLSGPEYAECQRLYNWVKDAKKRKEETYDLENKRFISIYFQEFAKEHNLPLDNINYLNDILFSSIFVCPDSVPCVGGGFLRRWFQGETLDEIQSDVDFFFRKNGIDDFVLYLSENGEFEIVKQNDYIRHIKYNNGEIIKDIQLINDYRDLHDPIGLLRTFDAYCNMICYDPTTQKITYHKDFIDQAKNKNYVYNMSAKTLSHVKFLRRIYKFMDEGYTVSDETLKNVIHGHLLRPESNRISQGY